MWVPRRTAVDEIISMQYTTISLASIVPCGYVWGVSGVNTCAQEETLLGHCLTARRPFFHLKGSTFAG